MTAPHYISENKSDMRGIKSGWYAIEDNGNLSSGPFSSREECVNRLAQLTNRTIPGCNKGRTETLLFLPTSGVEGGARRSTDNGPLKE